jgi:hypothetical protein
LKERVDIENMSLTERRALLPLQEQLMNVPEEPVFVMYTAPPYCSSIMVVLALSSVVRGVATALLM